MIEFNDLLLQLNSLGGVARNIELKEGPAGRGFFAKDPKKEVEIKVPLDLLAPVEWLELDEKGDSVLNESCNWNEAKKKFFNDYQKYFGWSGGAKDYIYKFLSELKNLPENVKNTLIKLNARNKLYSGEVLMSDCLSFYLFSRQVIISNKRYIMPVFELLNHNANINLPWSQLNGLHIKGNFKDEITINYNDRHDAVDLFCGYGFSTLQNCIYSGFLTINHPNYGRIHIGRFTDEFTTVDGVIYPKVFKDRDGVKITFLDLCNRANPELPFTIFSKLLLDQGLSSKAAAELFEGIKSQNRKLYIQLLVDLQNHHGLVDNIVKKMACDQLMALA